MKRQAGVCELMFLLRFDLTVERSVGKILLTLESKENAALQKWMEFSGIFWEHLKNSAILIVEPLAFKWTNYPSNLQTHSPRQCTVLSRILIHFQENWGTKERQVCQASCYVFLCWGGLVFVSLHCLNWSPTLYWKCSMQDKGRQACWACCVYFPREMWINTRSPHKTSGKPKR